MSIQPLAESLNLFGNLQEALKPNIELEMLSIKAKMLETDVQELKLKIS